jgi:alginate O-acetyltransferase complex protein AlgI
MTFISLTYPLFLLLVLGLYWILPRRGQNGLIVVASYVFYGWWDYRFCALLFASSAVDYLIGIGLARTESPRARKALLAVTLISNLGMLGFFKYYDFFAESLAGILHSLGSEVAVSTLGLILPVGISFYTFQTMSYTIDVYRKDLRACHSFLDYSAYVSFFPQLVAGPIERATHLLPQFQTARRFDPASATEGCRLLLWGVFKKMAVADNLGRVVDAVFANHEQASGGALACGIMAFALQIYGDFSAYSDMATGSARLFGITLMRNFAYPYFSRSVAEFWQRWHISLSTWFRDYVYVPLGGSRTTPQRTAFNVCATFFLSGLWHGASWKFLVWGMLNGLMVAIPDALRSSPRQRRRLTELPGGPGVLPSLRSTGNMAMTFILICTTWVFFRSPDIATAWRILIRIVTLAPGKALMTLEPARALLSLVLVTFLLAIEWLGRAQWDPIRMARAPRPIRWIVYTGLLWLAILLTPPASSLFIYFQF